MVLAGGYIGLAAVACGHFMSNDVMVGRVALVANAKRQSGVGWHSLALDDGGAIFGRCA
jgi:hypothetical protein